MAITPVTGTTSVSDALGAAVDAIAAAGVDTPRLDAELLLCAATGWDRTQLAAGPDLRLPVGSSRAFAAMVRRRVRREPVAYILGRKGFRRIELLVDRRVLIPRPETELLVEEAVSVARHVPGRGELRVLDVGTGSGAVGLAVADELPAARVTGIDTSMDALHLAQANCERLGLADRVDFVSGGVSSLPLADYDLVLANLPYVSESEWDELQPEIRDFEPREALVAGPTGVEVIETLVDRFRRHWKPAAVALEVGAGQAERVAELVGAAGFASTEARRDLAGIERVVVGTRVINESSAV
jgi:release factor glutamine methyltransferase